MNASGLIFSPGLPWPVIGVLAALAVVALMVALWRGLSGWALRTVAALAVLTALMGPSLQQEDRDPLADILLAIVDDSASQTLSDRPDQNAAALASLEAQVAARQGLELTTRRLSEFTDPAITDGTHMMRAITAAMADLPRDRVAGVVAITDGVVHDAELAPNLPAPFQALLTGRAADWDLRLSVTEAPAFAILGEQTEIRLRVDALGAPQETSRLVELSVSRDGADPEPVLAQIGAEIVLPLTLTHAGRNLIHVTLPAAPGELTDRNNAVVIEINGVRDRLRVLLVSGTPHPGTRTWRNLLKSDSAVDLVHFTILRPPEKQDGVPVNELSLIAFPTQELFVDKIDEFDLIIFDRYRLRGILPGGYLDSVRSYVDRGGAVLIAAGPALAGAESIARSALAGMLPAFPTGRLIEDAFRPEISDAGGRHPITRDLESFAPEGGWGPWLRRVELEPTSGYTILSGPDDAALLTVDRVGDGRVALLGSDQAWLWARGYEGGGPQLELLRRLAHWLMREPELEEEALSATATETGLRIERRTMDDTAPDATVMFPDGTEAGVALSERAPGLFEGVIVAADQGLYRIAQDDLTTVVVRGLAALREFEQPIANAALLAPLGHATNGAVTRIEDGLPGLRPVRMGQLAHGRGWIGYTPRNAYVTQAIRLIPLAPAWLMLAVAALSLIGAWLIEGRGGARRTGQPSVP
ncbi:hypothetical protein SAMN05444851_0989 [Aliiroseovarius sediminilitoris]|uniref:Glutamine amidotransferase n=1 Tax=Aliiroseovarius sediminilitoris TaxID=1173584 RepID=A0A1I0NPF1_9RHOB|nr:hypothetical protein [Aliiroseovarius sediminilitoris]SEW03234.1 hypothetical protein SAMN05444851_0989 [Aliiroseovarius sediminilitoris]